MARTKEGIPYHPSEYDPDWPRSRGINSGYMNSSDFEERKVPRYPRLPILLMGGMVESITHPDGFEIKISKVTEHALQSIQDAELKGYPSKHIMLDNIIEPTLLSNIQRTWPSRDEMDTGEPIGRYQFHNFKNHKYLNELYTDVINNIHVKCSLVDKLSEKVELGTPGVSLWEDTQSFTINDVHIDFNDFYVTLGIFLPDDESTIDYGTEFWDPHKYSENWEESFRKEKCDFIFRAPFKLNTGYAMLSDMTSYHSSPDIEEDVVRKHMYISYPKI